MAGESGPGCDARHSALVRYLGRVFENQGTVEPDTGADPARTGPRWGGFRATGGVAAAAAGSGIGRWTGRIGHGTPAGLGGQAMADLVRNSRIRPMLVARSALSGIAGHNSGHPLRTRCVLADAAGTARAVFLWSVEPLSRRLRRYPVSVSRGLLWIGASRWVTRGLPDRFSPISAGGSLMAATDGSSPLFEMAEHHSMQGYRPATYLEEVQAIGAHPSPHFSPRELNKGRVRGVNVC